MKQYNNILILSILYIFIILVLTLSMSEVGDFYIISILISSFIFSFFLIREIYIKYIVGFKPNNNDINYVNSTEPNFDNLKKISTKPFLFGLEKKLISDDEFYFDDDNFYAINKESQKAVFKLTDIVEVSKTSIQINNRQLWQVKIKQNNDREITFKFAHNYTIWNKNFQSFYEKVKAINPTAIKSKWSLWTL